MRLLFVCLLLCACQSKAPKEAAVAPVPDQSEHAKLLRDDSNAISVRLNATDTLIVEGGAVPISELQSALKAAKHKKGDTATVVIYVLGETRFGVFTTVHKTLEDLLRQERDSVALQRFNKPFENLEDAQKLAIQQKHKLRILEKINR